MIFQRKVYKKVQAVYCSYKCAYRGRILGYTKRIVKKPYNCKRKEPRTCILCGKEYIYSTSKQKYCSRKCFEKAHKENMKGKNNPAWINGSSYNKRSYRGHGWEDLRKEVYARDNWHCRICFKHCEGREIQCHHIENYNINKNNDLNNLITLCVACHGKVHNSKEVVLCG